MIRFQLFSLILIVFLSLACEKDSDKELIPEDYQRVKDIIFQRDDLPYRKLEFTYDENKLVRIEYFFKTDTSWKQDYLSEFSHHDGGFTQEYYFLTSEGLKYKHKNIYSIENDKLVKDVYYVGSRNEWYLNSKWSYSYENDRLTSYKIFKYTDDTWKERASAYFSYENSQIKKHTYYEVHDNELLLTDMDTFYWADNKLVHYIDYNRKYGQIELNAKSNFTYIDDKTTKIELQARRHDDWEFYKYTYYEYNEMGLLVSERVHWGDEMVITYEAGKGDFGIVYYMPEEIVFNKPRFKSTEEGKTREHKVYEPQYIDHLLFKMQSGF